MKCEDAKKLLEAYITGEIDEVALEALREHATICGDCRARMEEASRLEGALKSAYRTEPPVEVVMKRLRGRRRRWRAFWLGLIILGLLFCVLVAAFVALRLHQIWMARKELRMLLNASGSIRLGDNPERNAALAASASRQHIKDRLRKNAYLDPWGSPYRLFLKEGRMVAVSAGPDKHFNTNDDIILEGQLNEPPPRQNQ